MQPKLTPIINPSLIAAASKLPLVGLTKQSDSHLFYLKIDDAFIHSLFPLIDIAVCTKPDFFNKYQTGAHITIIYPEEKQTIDTQDLLQPHHFTLKNFFTARLGHKDYYALAIESPSLRELRKKYNLPDLLCFRGYNLGFHITIAIKT